MAKQHVVDGFVESVAAPRYIAGKESTYLAFRMREVMPKLAPWEDEVFHIDLAGAGSSALIAIVLHAYAHGELLTVRLSHANQPFEVEHVEVCVASARDVAKLDAQGRWRQPYGGPLS